MMRMTLGALALFCALGVPVLAAEKPPRPNVVYILCDDLGYGDLACFGNPIVKTPNLDRLARDGMKLTHCYAAAPVCSPSRAGIITGRHPHRCGIHDFIPANRGIYLKRDEVTVAQLLRSAAYRTGHVGKWHLNSKMDGSEPTPGDHGFDHWFSTQNNAAPSHENPTNFYRNGKAVGPLKGNSSTLIVDEAIDFMRGAKDRPFMLFVWFHAPHEPVAAPESFTRMYAGIDEATRRAYLGSITLMDEEVGRLVQALHDLKLRQNTFLMFTSDNGPETLNRYAGAQRSHGSPGPLRGMKLDMYEGGYRVPGIISWPGKTRAGQVCAEPVCGVDVLPTLCDLAGVALPKDRKFDGGSMLPIFAGESVQRPHSLYWQYDRALSVPWTMSLRQGPWKLLADAKREKFALYNLTEDPGEAQDQAKNEPKRVQDMSDAMERNYRWVNGLVPDKP